VAVLPVRMKDKERWMELCEFGSKEQDPSKLSEFVEEINRLLEEKQNRIRGQISVPTETRRNMSCQPMKK
jgi:hypothetical protein